MRYHPLLLLLIGLATTVGCIQPHKPRQAAQARQGRLGELAQRYHDPDYPYGSELPFNLPPAQMLAEPGPGVAGPGPGVFDVAPVVPPQPQYSQIFFAGPDGMVVNWNTTTENTFDSEPLVCPGAYDFPQGAIYRLKLTQIPGRPGVELYPTLEVGPTTPRTDAFLAHNKIPVSFTEEDFAQIMSGNFVTKVIYLPDPEFQDLVIAGVNVLVSSRLEPGTDPIAEADRKGSILAIVRVGNKDFQLPGGAPAGGPMQPVHFQQPGAGGPMAAYGHPSTAPSYISGATMPPYGMPYSGTPIGLPGPPHLPLGGPAGLQRHVITNHTKHHIPGPTPRIDIHVKQQPGLSYPTPPNTMYIHEQVQPAQPYFPSGRGVPPGAIQRQQPQQQIQQVPTPVEPDAT